MPPPFLPDTNAAWLDALRGPRQADALEALRRILVRGLRAALAGHRAGEMAEDFAQEALLRVLERLDTFRGESRFTTWAQKIAVRIALTELRRLRWKDVSLDEAAGPGEAAPPPPVGGPDPSERAGLHMLMAEVKRAMNEALTERQRTALRAVMYGGMPLEEVARRMGTNRNALYKLIHDARLRLRKALERRGIVLEEEWLEAS